MSLDSLINSWNKIDTDFYFSVTPLFVFWLIFYSISFLLIFVSKKSSEDKIILSTFISIAAIICLFCSFLDIHSKELKIHSEIWEETVFIPYITEMEDSKNYELISFTERTPLEQLNKENITSFNMIPSSLLEKSLYGELVYLEDGKEITIKDWFIIDYTEENIEAHFSYKPIEKDINEDFKKGYYNKTIVLPLTQYDLNSKLIIKFN